ncbi:DUF481 domain-containing protein [Niveispirillum sp. KHB5.9]|uniref:DUF481 domain-containing protein n=1 Tax=Niveispirillum sp. KHB5.9 TaxID=3400269 RepID=UPI003A875053
MLRQAAGRDSAALDLTGALRKDRKEAERAVKRQAASSLFAGWSGDAEAGASLSTGNSDDKSLSLRVDLLKETVKWRHEVTAGADLQRAAGETSKERFEAGYGANYFINPRFYAASEVGWERDTFAGYRHRVTETVGAGYVVTGGACRWKAVPVPGTRSWWTRRTSPMWNMRSSSAPPPISPRTCPTAPSSPSR